MTWQKEAAHKSLREIYQDDPEAKFSFQECAKSDGFPLNITNIQKQCKLLAEAVVDVTTILSMKNPSENPLRGTAENLDCHAKMIQKLLRKIESAKMKGAFAGGVIFLTALFSQDFQPFVFFPAFGISLFNFRRAEAARATIEDILKQGAYTDETSRECVIKLRAASNKTDESLVKVAKSLCYSQLSFANQLIWATVCLQRAMGGDLESSCVLAMFLFGDKKTKLFLTALAFPDLEVEKLPNFGRIMGQTTLSSVGTLPPVTIDLIRHWHTEVRINSSAASLLPKIKLDYQHVKLILNRLKTLPNPSIENREDQDENCDILTLLKDLALQHRKASAQLLTFAYEMRVLKSEVDKSAEICKSFLETLSSNSHG